MILEQLQLYKELNLPRFIELKIEFEIKN